MMKLTNTKQSSMIVYNASRSDLETGRRFIVPVTSLEADLTAITRRVWELANATESRIQFLGLCSDAIQELSLRRALATVLAMANYGNVSAESEILFGRDWLEGVKSRVRTGDVVVCWHEKHSDLLQAKLSVPIYFIPEIHPRNKMRSNWHARAAAWIGSIAIIILFFFLQAEFGHLEKGWVTLMQSLSVLGEFGLIWFWNNLFG